MVLLRGSTVQHSFPPHGPTGGNNYIKLTVHTYAGVHVHVQQAIDGKVLRDIKREVMKT